MQVRLRWFDAKTGVVREQHLPADAADAAAARLQAEGAVMLGMAAHRPVRRGAGGSIDVAWWCRELKLLLGAGMTVVEAMEALRAQPQPAPRAQVHQTIHDALQRGQPLSQALDETGCFPDVLLAGIRASERTGALIEALDDFLRYHDVVDRLRRQLVSAAIYPALVLTLGTAIVLFLLGFVVPRFAAISGDLRGPVGGATGLLIGASKALLQHGRLLALGALALVAGAGVAWRRGHLAALAWRLADAIGPVRRGLEEFRLAKLYQALALMVKGGYSLEESLERCQVLGLGDRLTSAVQATRDAVMRGLRVSEAFHAAALTDPIADRLMRVGERGGQFDRVLHTIAERHGQQLATLVERAARLAEPVLLMLVALVVGGVVVLMYMPVFDIAGSLR